jgi:phosphopantetheine adenylyltransferase
MDELEIVVVHNPNKNAMFSPADRVRLWQDSLAEAGLSKVEVSLLEGGLIAKHAVSLEQTPLSKACGQQRILTTSCSLQT